MFSQNDSNIIAEFFVDSVYCASNPEKPSVEKPKQVKIYKEDIESSYDNIKIVMTADVVYTGSVWQDQFINLGVNLTHDKKQKINSSDNISKNFVDRTYRPNEYVKLEFTKVFNVKGFESSNIEIYLKPTEKDYMWNPEHSVTLKNINIIVLGS